LTAKKCKKHIGIIKERIIKVTSFPIIYFDFNIDCNNLIKLEKTQDSSLIKSISSLIKPVAARTNPVNAVIKPVMKIRLGIFKSYHLHHSPSEFDRQDSQRYMIPD